MRPAGGVNLLWSRADAPLQPLTSVAVQALDDFDDAVFPGGWFGMFPLAGIPGAGDTELVMHGEIPRVAWEVTALSDTSVTCRTVTPSGFDVERTTSVEGSAVRVSTRARNRSGRAREVTWGEHPCFDRAVFGEGQLSAAVDGAFITPEASDPSAARFLPGQRFEWPWALRADGSLSDVTGVPADADGRHDHVCGALTDPSLEVSAPRLGGRIRVHVNLASTPDLLFWQHYRPSSSPWNGDVFGLEICSAPGRTLDDARAADSVTTVEPDGLVAWSMSVEWVGD